MTETDKTLTEEELRLRSARAVVQEICLVKDWSARVMPAAPGFRPVVVLRMPTKLSTSGGPLTAVRERRATYLRKSGETEDHAWLATLDELKRIGATS